MTASIDLIKHFVTIQSSPIILIILNRPISSNALKEDSVLSALLNKSILTCCTDGAYDEINKHSTIKSIHCDLVIGDMDGDKVFD